MNVRDNGLVSCFLWKPTLTKNSMWKYVVCHIIKLIFHIMDIEPADIYNTHT